MIDEGRLYRSGWRLLAAALALTGAASACGAKRASEGDCAKILDRIVEIELRERGFRDPALVERKKTSLRRLLAPELQECVGKRLHPSAILCIAQTASSEELSHDCLR